MTRTEALVAIAAVAEHTWGGIVQAEHLEPIFPGQPARHTASTFRTVAQWLESDSGVDADELMESTWA